MIRQRGIEETGQICLAQLQGKGAIFAQSSGNLRMPLHRLHLGHLGPTSATKAPASTHFSDQLQCVLTKWFGLVVWAACLEVWEFIILCIEEKISNLVTNEIAGE